MKADQDLIDQIIANDLLVQEEYRATIAANIAAEDRHESAQARASRLRLLGLTDI